MKCYTCTCIYVCIYFYRATPFAGETEIDYIDCWPDSEDVDEDLCQMRGCVYKLSDVSGVPQ